MIGIPSSSNSNCARRLSARCALMLVSAAVFLFTSAAHAGRYELVKGQGVEVCEAYEKNLNAVDLHEPLICEREIHPQFKEFKKPEWKLLDLWDNRFLLKSIESVFEGLPESRPLSKSDEEWLKHRATDKSVRWSPELHAASIDVDNDKRADSVVMYKNGICGIAVRTYSTALLVQDDASSQVDRKKTDLLLQNIWKDPKSGKAHRNPLDYLYNMYGVFQYKNVTYFDKVSARSDERNKLYVYRASNNRTTQMCEYRFVDDGK